MHGIPISVKDSINMKGMLSTIGCAYLASDKYRSKEDAVLVKQFLIAGAIPLVRGSMPQMALSMHTKNLVFGTAKNAH